MEEKLSKKDRLLLSNQFRILSFLDSDNSEDYILKAKILERGFEYSYDSVFSQISEGVSEEIGEEVHSILSMYNVINYSLEQVSKDDFVNLNLKLLKFDGFDANNDKHYYYANFIINEEGLYEDLSGQNLNSHSSFSLRKYRNILNAYKQMEYDSNLSLEQLKQLVDAI